MKTSHTKKQKFSVMWFVNSGPDDSHLIDVEVFTRLRDAMARFCDIKGLRPCVVIRNAWRSEYVAEDCHQDVVARSNLRQATARDAA